MLVLYGMASFFSVDASGPWTEQTGSGTYDWTSIASSSDGAKIVAVTSGGYIYTSINSGVTWTQRTGAGARSWFSVASSTDGTKLVAVVSGGGYIYTSTDSGANWTEQTSSGARNWVGVASSSDGTKLAAVVNNFNSTAYIYTSTDGGANWTEQTSSGARNWRGIASSADGTKLAAFVSNGYIYTSTDSGANWTERAGSGSRGWGAITSSTDGTKLVAVVYGGYIYTSTDGGANWTEQTGAGSGNWASVASSSDGTKIAAGASVGYISTSTDSGLNWTQETTAGSRAWAGIASSSDGSKLVAVATSGYIYTNVSYDPDEFVTTWKTDNPGVSSSTQITIPTTGGGYNYNVDWGDGSTSTGITGDTTHTYSTAGTYTVKITGTFPRIYFNNTGDRQKILSVEQWGTNQWTSMANAFYGCSNLEINAIDAPDLSLVSDTSYMFSNATAFNQDISAWDVSNVGNMYGMFQNATSFNQDISSWNVSSATHMYAMFSGATAFNQPLNSWDVSSVVNMYSMFSGATAFNQPLNSWDVSIVGYTNSMFMYATAFNQDISAWNVSSVTDMNNMFLGATAFNQPLNSWNVSNVANMSGMFYQATAFNRSLSSWNVSSVTNMNSMFLGATSFNQSLATWNVVNVTDMTLMFSAVTLSTSNYDATLIAWSLLTLESNVPFNGGSSTYCASTTQRASIVSTYNWTIIDGGTSCAPTTYTLTYTAGTNGTLTGDDSQTVNEGDDGTAVTAVPNSGYHFVSWSDSSTQNPRTDTNVMGNISVTASFAENSNGYASPPSCIVHSTPSTITDGESATLNWEITWSGSGRSEYYVRVIGYGIFGPTTSSLVVTPSSTTTYQLSAINLFGANFCETTVTVEDPIIIDEEEIVSPEEIIPPVEETTPTPLSCTLSASPRTLSQNQSTRLTWNISGGTSPYLTYLNPNGSPISQPYITIPSNSETLTIYVKDDADTIASCSTQVSIQLTEEEEEEIITPPPVTTPPPTITDIDITPSPTEVLPLPTFTDTPLPTDQPSTFLSDLYLKIADFFRSSPNGLIMKIITTTLLALSIITALGSSLFASPLSASELIFIPVRLWSILLTAFGYKKQSRPWGIIYDSVTKAPLDPVYVSLLDLNGKEVASSITDMDGRYGFLVPPGKYRIKAGKGDYTFPSTILTGTSNDALYHDLYFGDVITIYFEGDVIQKNIPLDPTGINWNEQTKQVNNLTHFYQKHDYTNAHLSNILFIIGGILATLALFFAPQPYNLMIFALYIVFLIIKILKLKPRQYSTITKSDGTPMNGIIHFNSPTQGKEVMKKPILNGKFYALIPNGNYVAVIEERVNTNEYVKVGEREVEVKEGIVSESITV
jgi:surface protein